MNGEIERGSGNVPVAYHQFDISDENGPAAPELARDHNGLIRVVDGVIVIMTGIHTGDVHVTVTNHQSTPALDQDNWQEIVEISAHSVSGELMVRGMMDDLDEELPVLSHHGPGSYRLRVYARGRDTAVDDAPDDVTEWYLIESWPAPTQPPTAVRQSDTYGVSVRTR
jgi:hypothetical protein